MNIKKPAAIPLQNPQKCAGHPIRLILAAVLVRWCKTVNTASTPVIVISPFKTGWWSTPRPHRAAIITRSGLCSPWQQVSRKATGMRPTRSSLMPMDSRIPTLRLKWPNSANLTLLRNGYWVLIRLARSKRSAVPSCVLEGNKKKLLFRAALRGVDGIWTRDQGFADPCLATWPRRHTCFSQNC